MLPRKTVTYESAKYVSCITRKCTHNGFVSGHFSVGFMQPGPEMQSIHK